MLRVGFEPGIWRSADWCLRKHSHGEFTSINAIFDEIIQHLLHSKVAKAELYLIGGYHNKWIELTYYIETLHDTTCILAVLSWVSLKGLCYCWW